MISNRLTISPDLSIRSFCDLTVQLKLTRDHSLGEVAFADEIRHHADFANRFGFKKEKSVAQTWFLFPEGALHICKNLPTPNLGGMRQRRRARVRVHRRAVSDDQKRAEVGSHGRNVQQPAPGASRMGPIRI